MESTAIERRTNEFHFRFVAKDDLVLVVDVVELLLGNVDASFRNKVDLVLFEDGVQIVHRFIEASGANLSSVVHQGDAEELAFASAVLGVGPGPDV